MTLTGRLDTYTVQKGSQCWAEDLVLFSMQQSCLCHVRVVLGLVPLPSGPGATAAAARRCHPHPQHTSLHMVRARASNVFARLALSAMRITHKVFPRPLQLATQLCLYR